MILRRSLGWWTICAAHDGTHAHNLTSVVDDAFVGGWQIVRGDDLPLRASPVVFGAAFGLAQPRYAHVPLQRGSTGKARDGADPPQLREAGIEIPTILGWIRFIPGITSMVVHSADARSPMPRQF